MTSRHLRALAWVIATIVGVGILALVDALFNDPFVTIGTAIGFSAFVIAVCRPGSTW